MISFLAGTVKLKTEKNLTVDVQGIGYEVFAPLPVLEKTKVGAAIELYTHLHVREDAMELYGFLTITELDFFKQLISVSGVGPKSAIGILSLTSVADLKKAISNGDASLLTKVSGIGRKTAERLIVELKNKVDVLDARTDTGGLENLGDNQAIDGLVHLGYSAREARDALQLIDKSITAVEQRVKAALKLMGKNK